MQDKPALQQALSRDLASIVPHLRKSVVLPFIRAFWITMSREWQHIEALRLDKYLYLIRRYLNASFEFLAKQKWKQSVVEQWNEILEETPLNTKDMRIPNGLRYHIMDIWVDELNKVSGPKWEKDPGSEIMEILVTPIEEMQSEGALKVLRNAAKECLSDERLRQWRGIEEEKVESSEEEEEAEWGGFGDE
jgi:ribosomal RNA-processing protein 1